jgi:phosphoglycerate dehydrogenase-like enzyme
MTTRLLIGQPRFSVDHEWIDLPKHFPHHLKVEMLAVETGVIESAILESFRPDIVVPIMSPITAAAIECGGFGLIQQFGVGTEAIDLLAATRAGVWVANMPGLNAVPVAEHAIALLLALYRRLPEAADGFVPGRWGEPSARSLAGSTACVVGLGAIGSAVAERLRVFGVRVIAVRRTRRPDDGPEVVGTETLVEAVANADCVVVTASHTAGRPPVVDAGVIAAMQPNAVLINVSRGDVIDNEAAQAAVRQGTLGGLGVDVFPEEPYPADGPLLGHPRILATAHTAALTDGYFLAASRRLGDAIERYVRGEEPRHTVNKPTFHRGARHRDHKHAGLDGAQSAVSLSGSGPRRVRANE